MRAERFHPGDGLRVEDVPRPEVGPGEVVVEVAACGVCHSDLHVLEGDLPLAEPRTPCHEVAGTVAETGDGVDLAVGTDLVWVGSGTPKAQRAVLPSMNVADLKEEHDHPSWFTAAGTFAAYGVVIVVMALLLFGVPWLIFTFL